MSTYNLKNNNIYQYFYVYYLALGFLVFFLGFNQILKMPSNLVINSSTALILFNGFPMKITAIIITSLFVALAAVSRKFLHLRSFRVLTFILLLFFEDMYNSSGLKTNLFIFWFWSLLGLCFLPDLKKKSEMKRFFYLVWTVWFQRAIVLLFYFLSGFWKFIGFCMQLVNGEEHIFTKKGLSYHLASEIIRTQGRSVMADLILENTFLNPLMMLSVLLLQLSTIYFLYKQKHLWIMGLGLLMFHFGGMLALNIPYPTNFLLVSVLFLQNPFANLKNDSNFLFAGVKN